MWVLKIQIKSNQAIQITSEQDIQFQAASVHLTAKEEISLEGKNSSLILDNETHFKSSKVMERFYNRCRNTDKEIIQLTDMI